MKRKYFIFSGVIITLLAILLAGCATQSDAQNRATTDPLSNPTAVQPTTAQPTEVQQTYTDPFAYCAAVGTIDIPDMRYTGPKITDAIINGYKDAAGLQASTEPMEMFKQTTTWRCMDGKVYACNVGANLPCSSKANTDKTPSQAMLDYCKANPDADFIPESVTGHSTIYSWHCSKDTPELLDQIAQVDAAGYLANIWYPIEPNAPSTTPVPDETPVNVETIQPLTVEVCDGEAQAMAHYLNVLEVTQADTPLADWVTNTSGTGCQATVVGTGVDFKSPLDVYNTLADMLVSESWTEDIKLESGGPTGIGGGYRKDNQICLISALWQPDASANCSKDQPISACLVKPEQQNYTITLNCGVETVSTPTPQPSPAPTSMGGASGILFSSTRSGSQIEDLYLLDFASQSVSRLTQGDANTFPGPFSPDGKQIVYASYGPGMIHTNIGLMNADGSNPVNLTPGDKWDNLFPTWSPDGSQIAFNSFQNGNNDIFVMAADGSQVKNLTNNPRDDFAPSWSPDGKLIAFVSDRDNQTGINSIYIMHADGSNVTRLTHDGGNDYAPTWSPDGAQVAFYSYQKGQSDIYVVNVDGSSLTNLTNDPADDWMSAWSPDGTLIAYQTNRDGNWEIYVMNADGSNPTNLTNDPADDQRPFWAPATQIANPASANCVKLGGKLAIENRDNLGEMGVCYFEDNFQCEEWALLRGDCPVGGLKVTGYITEAARFCAITGGEYTIAGTSGAALEQGTCTFKNGKTCDVWKYYDGTCTPND